jgi:biotin carboxylase
MANRPAQRSDTPEPIPPVGTGTTASLGPDQPGTAASAPPPDHGSTAGTGARRPLNGIPEIRHFFRTNTDPVYFIGATAFNLLGLDRWVRNFYYIAYYDSWDGGHPRVFTPTAKPPVAFTSSEDVNNYLLRDPEVQQFIARRGGRPRVAMVFFDEETEQLCRELGYELILPPHELRRRLDSKLVTTRLGNEAGAPSVPNVLVSVNSWETLVSVATEAGLTTDVVVQTPYGDSGKTTFFISSEDDWRRHAAAIVDQEVKVMKRINHKAAAVEAVITRHGTVVGPFMTDLTGYPELTPYKGGWCGNDLFPGALSEDHRERAVTLVRRLGDRLSQEGYRGFFEVDVLVDLDSDEVYLGELNPRISGASSITNVTAGAYADIPLFLFHLLEYMDVDFTVDVDEINQRWKDLAALDVWSQIVMKETSPGVERIDAAPRTGQWFLDDHGQLHFRRAALDWHQLQEESECFWLRVYGPGDYRYKGADLGILVTKGRLQTDEPQLTPRCRQLIEAIRAQYATTPIEEERPTQVFSPVK